MSDEKCPVDHKSREAWLAQARAQQKGPSPSSPPASCPVDHSKPTPTSWTQTLTSYLPWSSSTTTNAQSPTTAPETSTSSGLGTSRVTSTIPRTSSATPTTPSEEAACPVPHGASANAETVAGHDASGNWVYPSEKMFFDAMRRKGHDAREQDMKMVVPIHNAVNERAWDEIRRWEGPYLQGSTCDGPRLTSFANKNDRMTPTARFNTILGYTAPFDRHDWVIDRCGKRVDYVIDFYAGRGPAKGQDKGGPTFYLDVRPKLNTWEGWKMRAAKWTYLV